jgi:hypothetical protein
MNYRDARNLQIGDRVGFRESSVHAHGVVIEDLGSEYVKVRWLDCPFATTHRRHALGFKPIAGRWEWATFLSAERDNCISTRKQDVRV